MYKISYTVKIVYQGNKMWSLYTCGLYMQGQSHGKYIPEDLHSVVLISKWSLYTGGL